MLTTSIILSARSVHFLKKEMTTGLNSGASLSGHLYKKRDVKDPKIIDISPLYMCMHVYCIFFTGISRDLQAMLSTCRTVAK